MFATEDAAVIISAMVRKAGGKIVLTMRDLQSVRHTELVQTIDPTQHHTMEFRVQDPIIDLPRSEYREVTL